MRQLVMRLLVVLVLAVLEGCGSMNLEPDYDLAAHPGKGVVVISVTLDGDRDATFRPNRQLEIFGRELSSGRQVVWLGIRSSDFDFGEHALGTLLVREMEAGVAELRSSNLYIGGGGGSRLSIRTKRPPPVLSFEIKPGVVTYLGNVHTHLLWGESSRRGRVVVGYVPVIADQSERDLGFVYSRYPQFKGKAEKALLPLGPWFPRTESQGASAVPSVEPAASQ